jgi:hypothetical protein
MIIWRMSPDEAIKCELHWFRIRCDLIVKRIWAE